MPAGRPPKNVRAFATDAFGFTYRVRYLGPKVAMREWQSRDRSVRMQTDCVLEKEKDGQVILAPVVVEQCGVG